MFFYEIGELFMILSHRIEHLEKNKNAVRNDDFRL